MTRSSDFSTLRSPADAQMIRWLNAAMIIKKSTHGGLNHSDPLEPKDHKEE